MTSGDSYMENWEGNSDKEQKWISSLAPCRKSLQVLLQSQSREEKRDISIKSCRGPSRESACSGLELCACALWDTNAARLQLQKEAKLSPQPMMSPFLYLQMTAVSSSSSRSARKRPHRPGGVAVTWPTLTVKQKRGQKWEVLFTEISELKSVQSASLSEYAVSPLFFFVIACTF